MRGKFMVGLAFLAWVCAAPRANADEILLKDGTKITGTVVGFENDSFRVETSYGFALVRKDKVADITISGPSTSHETKANPPEPAPKPGTSPQTVFPTVSRDSVAAAAKAAAADKPREDAGPVAPPASAGAQSNAAPPPVKSAGATEQAKSAPATFGAKPPSSGSSTAATHTGAKTEPTTTKAKGAATVGATPTAGPVAPRQEPPAPPPAAPAPPEPPVIHDEIRGNQYVNETYGFQMYRPPSWDLIPAARKALPDAVAALGTSDQTTLLVIGREHAKGTLDSHAAATEKALGEVYVNYRLISSRKLSVAGSPAIEQRSRGTADGRDWSVVLLTLLRGTDAYTLLGMTWADSDLIQVQENVIAKAVNSLTFVNQ